ncbi:MAG: SirB2 family protein [Betaproteobacteria bacterium]
MTFDYPLVKHVHVAAVAVSLALFAVRGAWMLAAPEMLRRTWVRIVPHVVDTLLLASALWLVWEIGPGAGPWIAAKVAGLVVYIGVGIVALRAGKTRAIRVGAFVFALATFAWIVSVALTKSPLGFFAPLARL